MKDEGTDAATRRDDRPKVKRTRPTRKEFLKGAAALGASLLATGCDITQRLPNLPGIPPAGDRDTNVVLVIVDSLRKDHVGAYGNRWIETPNLDALAKESLRFT